MRVYHVTGEVTAFFVVPDDASLADVDTIARRALRNEARQGDVDVDTIERATADLCTHPDDRDCLPWGGDGTTTVGDYLAAAPTEGT